MENNYYIKETGDWPFCDLTDDSCADTEILNELSCSCLPDPDQSSCSPYCDAGMFTSPADPCECITEEQLVALFPSWASMNDIYSTISRKAAPEPELDLCPWFEHQYECLGKGNYWNELACTCFVPDLGGDECPDGEMRDPLEY